MIWSIMILRRSPVRKQRPADPPVPGGSIRAGTGRAAGGRGGLPSAAGVLFQRLSRLRGGGGSTHRPGAAAAARAGHGRRLRHQSDAGNVVADCDAG